MISVVTAQREVLLNPTGTNIWSGQVTQSLNSQAVTWSLAKRLYGFDGPYWIIPISLAIGMVPTFLQWLIHKVSRAERHKVEHWNDDSRFSAGLESDLSKWKRSCSPLYTWYAHSIPALIHSSNAFACIKYSAWMYVGVNSTITSSIIVGLVSQLWLRKYHPGWYKKYNYILGGALDGGAQVMIFILSFAVFGASGVDRPFPRVSAVNPLVD